MWAFLVSINIHKNFKNENMSCTGLVGAKPFKFRNLARGVQGAANRVITTLNPLFKHGYFINPPINDYQIFRGCVASC